MKLSVAVPFAFAALVAASCGQDQVVYRCLTPDAVDAGGDAAIETDVPVNPDVPALDAPPGDTSIADTPPEVFVCGADAPCDRCSTCKDGACVPDWPTAPGTEAEAANAKGANDTFDQGEPIPLGQDVTGHIGAAGDVDFYRFCAGRAGVVTVTVDFAASFKARGVNQVLLHAYTDAWTATKMAFAISDPKSGPSCSVYDTLESCDDHVTFRMNVDPAQGVYGIDLSAMGGEGLDDTQGFDSKNAYVLRVDFEEGPSLEADQPVVDGIEVGAADTWRTAYDFGAQPASGSVEAASFGWYWYDVDWYRFSLPQKGWMRLCMDTREMDDGVPASLSYSMFTMVYRKTDAGFDNVADPSLSAMLGDAPNCTASCSEATDVPPGDIFVYVQSAPGAGDEGPYRLRVDFGPGGPEDDQAGAVPAVDFPLVAHDLGTLEATPLSASSYFWKWDDDDWYRFVAPAGGGKVEVTVDYAAALEAKGWFDCVSRPQGLDVRTYLFDSVAAEFPALVYAAEDGAPAQTLQWDTAPGATYWLLVRSDEGIDREQPYTITIQNKLP